MVCDAVEIFPHASVAVQVRLTLYEPAHDPGAMTSAEVRVNALPQLSEAVATANTGVAGQFIVVGAGRAAITGAVISCTLMVCNAVDEFPQASEAVHVLVRLYDPAHAPAVVTSFDVNVNALPQASTAVATANTGVAGQLIVVGAGNEEITGAVIS